MPTTCRPNRATGSRTSMIIQEEDCWGQLATPGSQNARGLDRVTEEVKSPRAELESQILRADRMSGKSRTGNQTPGGPINGELQPATWGILLKHALGADVPGTEVSTSGSGPYTHVLQGGAILPEGLTIEKAFEFPSGDDADTIILRYLGCRINQFFMSCTTNAMVSVRVDPMAKEEVDVSDSGSMDPTPIYASNNEPFVSFEAAIDLDMDADGVVESVATAKSIDLTINNQLAAEEFALNGEDTRADLPEQKRIVSGNIVLMFTRDNYELYKRYKENATLKMRLTLTNAAGHSWDFFIPNFCLYGDPTPTASGPNALDLTFTWKAHRDDNLNTDIIVTIVNDEATLSTAA